jgi:hypothetical protein
MIRLDRKIDESNWEPYLPEEIYELFKALTIPWWIAGGWAIDLFLGSKTRDHLDIDIQILRKDQIILQKFLEGWYLYKTNQPGLKPWKKNEFLQLGVNSIWCRKTPEAPWNMQILFLESEGDEWFYRRKPSVQGFISEIGMKTKSGIPYLSPEIQLLFKAQKNPKQKDKQDFLNVLPFLDKKKLMWLKKSVFVHFGKNSYWIEEINKFF